MNSLIFFGYLQKSEWGIGEQNEENDGNAGIRMEMMRIRGIRVGKQGIGMERPEIWVEIRGIRGGNSGNQGENRIGVEMMSKNCGKGK